MESREELKSRIFSITHADFEELALSVFQYQAKSNPIYSRYLNLLKIKAKNVKKFSNIPFLPVEVFKRHSIIATNIIPQKTFESSHTTGTSSFHPIADISLYEQSILKGFEYFFGFPAQYVFLALLPSYTERGNSSLIYMVHYLMKKSGQDDFFFLNDFEALNKTIENLKPYGKKIFLIGVSFALLDFSKEFHPNLCGHIVMETGGMKGRRQELIREDLHARLSDAFQIEHIASEYGMTEMLSQAYALKDGMFHTPPWLRIFIRESNDPFAFAANSQSGGINVMDMANLDSCAFIAMEDIGRKYDNDSFEMLGRFDSSEIRGCSQMYL